MKLWVLYNLLVLVRDLDTVYCVLYLKRLEVFGLDCLASFDWFGFECFVFPLLTVVYCLFG